ncbi:hypothetical protein EDD15DRAFT_2300519 [Pisolithus albus]|nr:hypothetical protein EDD15DRAFT_2300519 [Pisolithus albus]
MDDEKSTSNSEPKVDPEPHPTAASDGKGVGAAEAEPDGIDPASPSSSIGAVDDNKFLDNDPTQSDESRTPSGKEQADASLHNATDHPSPKTLQERCYSEAAPEPQVVVTPPLDHSQHGSVDIPPNANDSISPPDPSPSSTLVYTSEIYEKLAAGRVSASSRGSPLRTGNIRHGPHGKTRHQPKALPI